VDWINISASAGTGSFSMGSPASEKCRQMMGAGQMETQHTVTLTHDFNISAFEVTQGQFKLFMDYNPSAFSTCGSACPVENVTWHEAVAYCNALSTFKGLEKCYADGGSAKACSKSTPCASEEVCIKGKCAKYAAGTQFSGKQIYTCKGFRLPTEAEWEYAYRAGTKTALYNGDLSDCQTDPKANLIGWYSGNAHKKTYPGCMKAANKFGLFDMVGNVSEWIHDWYLTDLGSTAQTDPFGKTLYAANVVRGGDYKSVAHLQRAAFRRSWSPWLKGDHVGFRCVRSK